MHLTLGVLELINHKAVLERNKHLQFPANYLHQFTRVAMLNYNDLTI